MPKLNDTLLIPLSTAAPRDGGNLLPMPETLTEADDRATKAIAALIKPGFAEKRETTDATAALHIDGDLRFGVFITDAGLAAIDGGSETNDKADTVPNSPKPERASNSAAVIAPLQRDRGATLAELIAATGWLPHKARAALTGLRKKGHIIERSKRIDETCYRITAAA